MPIRKKALLEIWLDNLHAAGIQDILVNLHFHAEIVREFLQRPKFGGMVSSIYEPDLLGTAGSLRANFQFYPQHTVLMAHADNLCLCDFDRFITYHLYERPANTVMTMMTFRSPNPESCGIVKLSADGVVTEFHEKVSNPPGNLANAAIYILEPAVINWVQEHGSVSDFSTQVLPNFVGKIASWENKGIMRDIGTTDSLRAAQAELTTIPETTRDTWQSKFESLPFQTEFFSNP